MRTGARTLERTRVDFEEGFEGGGFARGGFESGGFTSGV